MRHVRSAPFVLLVLLASAARPAALAAAEAPLEIESYNRTYTGLIGDLEPYVLDPVRVQLRSPSQILTVRANRIRATPGPDGTLVGQVELDVMGKGALVADVDLGGPHQSFEDEVILPPQTIVIPGRARLEKVKGGYRVHVLELPERISVTVQSRLATQVVNLCGAAEVLTLGAVSCSGLENALTRPSIPVPPEAGDVYLSEAELTAADRAQLDRWVRAAR